MYRIKDGCLNQYESAILFYWSKLESEGIKFLEET